MDLRTTKSLLRRHNIHPNKLRGQNFLVNGRAAERIIESARIDPDETVLEIGPGLGALTSGLLERAKRVVAVEIDFRLCAILASELGHHPGLDLMTADFLRTDIAEMARNAQPGGLKVVGNLPYQITGSAVRKILDHLHLLRGAVITVQREVAARMMTSPGTKTFGALSVATQYYCVPQMVLQLPKEAFYPRPKVTSTTVILQPRDGPPMEVRDQELFFTVVRALFGHRRKMAGNALRNHPHVRLTSHELKSLSGRLAVDLSRRGETMSLNEMGQISDALWEIRHAPLGN